MNLGIRGKTALVTGAGRGIGRAIAQSLAQEGVKVCVTSRGEGSLKEVFKAIGGKKSGHLAIASDIAREGEPLRVVKAAEKRWGSIDIVVNNVGGTLDISDPYCGLDKWREVWRLNMEVAVEINNAVLGKMQKKKWGRICNISSISGLENHGPLPYCAAKAAMIAYTRSLGRLVSPDGVIVTAVLPGAVYTEGGYWEVAAKEKPDHVKKYLAERMASHRFGKVEEISGVVAFLCSRQASFCVGSVMPVDGGQGRNYFAV